eukprot:1159633-Pelagomonas_calceolata.AAC.10
MRTALGARGTAAQMHTQLKCTHSINAHSTNARRLRCTWHGSTNAHTAQTHTAQMRVALGARGTAASPAV